MDSEFVEIMISHEESVSLQLWSSRLRKERKFRKMRYTCSKAPFPPLKINENQWKSKDARSSMSWSHEILVFDFISGHQALFVSSEQGDWTHPLVIQVAKSQQPSIYTLLHSKEFQCTLSPHCSPVTPSSFCWWQSTALNPPIAVISPPPLIPCWWLTLRTTQHCWPEPLLPRLTCREGAVKFS